MLCATTAQPLAAQTADSITLDQALVRARATRPIVAAAAAGVERARGARGLAKLVPNPSAQLETDDLSPTRKLTVVQPLGWLPRRFADVAAGRALVERASADSAQLLADLGRDVRRAFFAALAADERRRLVGEQAGIADSLARLADRRVAAGDLSALERDQIVQEAGRARLFAAQAREAARVARVGLARALASAGGDSFENSAPRPAGRLDAGLDETLASSSDPVSDLPALRAALADSAGAAARLRAARIATVPVPSIVAGREWRPTPTALPSNTSSNNLILGLALPVPLFNQGREALAEARGAAHESAARASETRLALSSQLAAARIRLAESGTRARFARDSLAADAGRIRAGAVRLYESGRTGILPVFDALRTERDVAQTLVLELLAFQEARADLDALLGRWP